MTDWGTLLVASAAFSAWLFGLVMIVERPKKHWPWRIGFVIAVLLLVVFFFPVRSGPGYNYLIDCHTNWTCDCGWYWGSGTEPMSVGGEVLQVENTTVFYDVFGVMLGNFDHANCS